LKGKTRSFDPKKQGKKEKKTKKFDLLPIFLIQLRGKVLK